MAYTVRNFKSKAELKRAFIAGEAIAVFQPGPFELEHGSITLEGPHYPEPHRWYVQAAHEDGFITKLACCSAKDRAARAAAIAQREADRRADRQAREAREESEDRAADRNAREDSEAAEARYEAHDRLLAREEADRRGFLPMLTDNLPGCELDAAARALTGYSIEDYLNADKEVR